MNPPRLETDATQLAKIQLLQNILQLINSTTIPNIDASTTNTLLGSQNHAINSFNQGLINGQPNSSALNPYLSAGAHNQTLPDSWTCVEGKLKNPTATSSDNSLGSSYNYVQQENTLPQLVSASHETSNFGQVERNRIQEQFSKGSLHSDIFEAWEKLMDDDTSDSYWKNVLE